MDLPQQFDLLSTTLFDPFLSSLSWNNDNQAPSSFLLLPYHFDRLVIAIEKHGWEKARATLNYDALKSKCQDAVSQSQQKHGGNAFRIRITITVSGEISAEASPRNTLTISPELASTFNPRTEDSPNYHPYVAVYVDRQPTPSSIFTSTKTTYRVHYDDARARNGLPSLKSPLVADSDILLYNSSDDITETTIFNVAFHYSDKWVTPSTNSGCLPGVMRRWLLEKNLIYEDNSGLLKKQTIKTGDWVLLFNGLQGCRLGKFVDYTDF